MSRGTVPGLVNPHPLGAMLPGLYQEDELAQRLTAAFDEVLAPVLSTLDNIDAYFDPMLTPEDFLQWLAGWVGLLVDETWTSELTRTFVAQTAELYRWRGTEQGVADLVDNYVGGSVEVVDSGGVGWSASPGADLPGDDSASVTVRVRVSDPSLVDVRRLETLVAAAVPAHIARTVEVVTR